MFHNLTARLTGHTHTHDGRGLCEVCALPRFVTRFLGSRDV